MALLNFRSRDESSPAETPAELGAFLRGYSIEVMPRTAAKVDDFKKELPSLAVLTSPVLITSRIFCPHAKKWLILPFSREDDVCAHRARKCARTQFFLQIGKIVENPCAIFFSQ